MDVSTRDLMGTAAAGRLRRLDDVVPGVVYGAGLENVNITLPSRVLLKAMQSDSFLSQIIELQLNGVGQQVVVREVQRHPVTDNVTHIDFLRIREDQELQVAVPIRYINEEECVGVRLGGGTITRNLVEVEVSCLPKDLPEAIEVDMLDVELGSAIHLSGLALPEGVTIPGLRDAEDASRDLPVVSVSIQRIEIEEEEEVLDEDELALAEEGDEEADEETTAESDEETEA